MIEGIVPRISKNSLILAENEKRIDEEDDDGHGCKQTQEKIDEIV